MCFLNQIKRSPRKVVGQTSCLLGLLCLLCFQTLLTSQKKQPRLDLSSENVLLVLIARVSSTVLQCRRGTFFTCTSTIKRDSLTLLTKYFGWKLGPLCCNMLKLSTSINFTDCRMTTELTSFTFSMQWWI